MRIKIKTILEDHKRFLNQEITVCGWARTIRDMKEISFISLYDGSCFKSLQVVISDNREILKQAGGIGSSFRITGKLLTSISKGQECELLANNVEIIGTIEDPSTYPLAKTKVRHSNEYLRTIAHLRPRTNLIGAVARIRHNCAFATHEFFHKRDFLYINTPIITTSDCEGAGEMFKIAPQENKHFFGEQAYLTVSGQLNVETYASALSDVYTFGPTFRAENSNTSRHLAEFWMIEPEISFATLQDDIDLAVDYIKYITRYVLDHSKFDLEFFDQYVEAGLITRLKNVISNDFIQITYSKAISVLVQEKLLQDEDLQWGIDLTSEQEKYLAKFYGGPVIITHYPKDIKAFYMKISKSDPRTVEAMDIIVPKIGELIGGSAREENLELLDQQIKDKGLQLEDFSWYRDLRKYGTVPHAGFGVGFERLIMFVTGVENIRDVIPFPRWPGHCSF